MKYNVFISYRRDGGEYTAKVLRDKLGELGYNVFFDVEALRSGDFNTKLYSVIDECKDFILVLSPGALDRCQNDDDWVRREVEYALERGKNIVPILLRGFKFPDILPPSMESVRYKNGIEANTEFFDAFIRKLQEFLESKPLFRIKIKSKAVIIAVITAVLLVLLYILGMNFLSEKEPRAENEQLQTEALYPTTNAEKNLVREVIYYTQMNLTNLDIMAKAAFDALETAEAYLSSNERSFKVAKDEFEIYRKLIENVDASKYAPDDALVVRLEDSPFNVADFKALNSIVEMFRESYLENLDMFLYIISDDFYYSDNYKLKNLAQYRVMLESEIKAYQNGANILLLPITENDAMKEWFGNIVLQFSILELGAGNWLTDKEALELDSEMRWKKYEGALMEMASLIGYASEENAEMQKDIDQMTATIQLIEKANEAENQSQELYKKQKELLDMYEQQMQAFQMLE